MRKGRPEGSGDPSGRGPVDGPGERRPGRPISAWGRAFEAENERRRRETAALEVELMAADEEPGNKSHEIIWVTREIAVCPPCKRAYRKTRLAAGTSIARAEDLEGYFRQVGIFAKMAPILQERQDKRAEEQAARDKAKQGTGFRGKGRGRSHQDTPTYD